MADRPPMRPTIKVALRPVQVPVVDDTPQSRFNSDVGAVLRSLGDSPMGSGIWLENVDLILTEVAVPHKLGKTPRGYVKPPSSWLPMIAVGMGAGILSAILWNKR